MTDPREEPPARRSGAPERPTMIRAALFDLDKTITRIDTAQLYIRYQRTLGEVSPLTVLRVAGWALQYTLGVIDAPKVATKALRSLAGFPEESMTWRCDDWNRNYVSPHITDGARQAIERHRGLGHALGIVTGSSIYASRPLARALGIPLLAATELTVEDGRFTGDFVKPLCYGEGKIEKARKLLDPLGIALSECVFYSDSLTDVPLLEVCGEAVCVNPDPRLAREAKRRGWPIQRW
jgi:HAD superfamily hydrolase (TIGR01490 family)